MTRGEGEILAAHATCLHYVAEKPEGSDLEKRFEGEDAVEDESGARYCAP